MSETNITLDQLPEAVQQTLAGLAARAKAGGPPEAFFTAVLDTGFALLEVEAGGVWLIDPQHRLVLECERGLADSEFLSDPMLRVAFEQPFRSAIEQRSVLSHSSQQERLEGPGRIFTALLAGLGVNSRPAGLLQFVERANAEAATRPQRLTILGQLGQLLGQSLERMASRPAGGTSSTPPGSAPVPASQPRGPGPAAGGNVSSTQSATARVTPGPGPGSVTPAGGQLGGGPARPNLVAPAPEEFAGPATTGSSGGFPAPFPLPGPAGGGGSPPGRNLPPGQVPPATQLPPGILPPGVVLAPGPAGGGAGGGSPVTATVLPASGGSVVPHAGLLALHEHLQVRDAAAVIANESRRWLEVDRVAVAERIGKRLKIQAVSGSVSVNARSNVVQMLTKLVEKVVESGERLVFDGESHKLPPSIETPLANYLHESRSRAVIIEPLFDPIAVKKFEESGLKGESERVERPRPLGALVVEQISDTPLPANLVERMREVGDHAGLALRNAQQHERIFLLPVWKFLGNYASYFRGRRLAQWLGGLVALGLVTGLLTWLPWDYRVEGKGRLMPLTRQSVFAPWDGDVVEVAVQTGQQVTPGTVLLRLKNEELQARLLAQQNLKTEKEIQIVSLRAQISEGLNTLPATKLTELNFDRQKLEVELEGVTQQVAALQRQVDALTVVSTGAGVVATFRVGELLRERPVRRGELLVEVMDPKQGWRLELDVPENRLGHLLEAQKTSGSHSLPLRYVLATRTEETFEGTLDQLGSRAVVSEEEGSVVPVFAKPGETLPPDPQIGAEVIAKIHCGQKPLGYVLFGDVIEFLRKRLWL